jgi:multidrug efflux pump subunit AcrA (membrane-fusion protein)
MTMSKEVLWLLPIMLLVACGTSADGRDRRTGGNAEPTPIPTAVVASRPTYQVARGDVIYGIEFSGRIAPVTEQALAFAIDGVVKEVYATRGQQVRAGDPVVALETVTWEREQVLAQAAWDIAQSQLDALETGVDPALKAEVAAAALRVAELENLIARTRLNAPFDGQITALNLIPGRAVTTGEAVGVIADPAQIEVTASLREAQLQGLAEGMAVQIVPAGSPGDPLGGTIRRLPYPYGSGGQTAFAEADQAARIQFDDANAALARYAPSDRVSLSIVVTRREDVMWLPPAAIRDFNGRKFVVVQVAGGEQRKDVRLGIEGNGRVEILEGLEVGQTIVGQ